MTPVKYKISEGSIPSITIACSCSDIIMGKHSNLGPIDPQINGKPTHGIIEEFNKAKAEIAASPQTIPVWQTILSKYSPTLIGECEKAIKWSESMVKDWLFANMFEGEDDAVVKSEAIIKELGSHALTLSHDRHLAGLHGYKVDGDGNINRIEDTGGETYGGDEYDVVFKADTYKPGQSEGDGYRVNDNSILSQLSNSRTDSKGYRVRYSKNSSGEETFGLFIYLAHNTDVEWTMIGTRDGENENFVLGTRQFESNGFNPKLVGYSEMNETFNLHSHPRTPGASGFGYNKIFGDRRYVGEKTKRLMGQGQAAPPPLHIP